MRRILVSTAEVNRRKTLVRGSGECTFYRKVAVDFFACDKNLLSGVTLRIAFRRAIDVFVLMSDDMPLNITKSKLLKLTCICGR